MPRGGVECIIGTQRDPTLGPMLMLGVGGVGVASLNDVAWRTATDTESRDSIEGNPILVLPAGEGATAPDAVISTRGA